jgi:RHS repeat-associated protein
MDKLSYGFQSINGQPTNRLATLTDAGDKLNTLALENAVHNYTYDHSGNLLSDVKADISAITWTPDGKVDRVTKTNGKVIQFLYDARGDKVCGASLGDEYEYYLRDANGEILEILTIKAAYISGGTTNDPWKIVEGHPDYEAVPVPPSIPQKGGKEQNLKDYDLDELQETCSENPTPEQMVLQSWKCWDTTSIDIVDESNPFLNPLNQQPDPLAYFAAAKNEWLIYGSEGHGRFAKANPNDNDRWGYSNEIFLRDEPFTEDRYLKSKQYELKDHLGNVRVVLSDFKSSVVSTDSTRPYNATVLSAYNYYPFGMLQPGMYSEVNNTYRFGFNGMMRLDKVMDLVNTSPEPNEGVGNALDFGARLYNPRVARFFQPDPLRAQFPWVSPYVAYNDNPVSFIDKEGKWAFWEHHFIIEEAFKKNTSQLRTVLKLASNYADSDKFQTVEYSNQHAMMIPGQTFSEYIDGINTFLKEKMDKYVESGKISELGLGLHGVMDITCPAHFGKVWKGKDGTSFNEDLIHLTGDINYLGSRNKQFNKAVDNVEKFFNEAVARRKEYILNNPELENKQLFVNDLNELDDNSTDKNVTNNEIKHPADK